MNRKLKASFIYLSALSAVWPSQHADYHYSRPLTGVKNQWHTIVLPQEMYGRIQPSFADLRIFGITHDHDTIEAPYVLKSSGEESIRSNAAIEAKVINRSHNSKGSYFTLEVPDIELNTIYFEFNQENYDWKVTLEGSHDQKEWFTIVSDYRILSIRNGEADYSFSRLSFPDSKYRYFRLFIPGSKTADLKYASFPGKKPVHGKLKQYSSIVLSSKNEKQAGRTMVDLELTAPVPVSLLAVHIQNQYDYFRPVTVEYLADSFKTEQGWKYNYAPLGSGILNSVDGNELALTTTIAKRLRVIIENHDNEPLTIDSFVVKGPEYRLTARFDREAGYFLVYGSKEASAPDYDLVQFEDNIPSDPSPLTIGEEVFLSNNPANQTSPLFENKAWLWVIMGVIILVIGWFSLSMMRNVK